MTGHGQGQCGLPWLAWGIQVGSMVLQRSALQCHGLLNWRVAQSIGVFGWQACLASLMASLCVGVLCAQLVQGIAYNGLLVGVPEGATVERYRD